MDITIAGSNSELTDLFTKIKNGYSINILEIFLIKYFNPSLPTSLKHININSIYVHTDGIYFYFDYDSSTGKRHCTHYLNSENDIVDIISKIKELYNMSKPIITDTISKQYHNEKEYNSISTITNKKLVIIKYLKESFSPLLSMTIGDYYIAEKTIDNGHEMYSLLTHNKMQRTGDKPISVRQKLNGVTGRFEEFEIDSWIEENDFENTDIKLMPTINNSGYPMTLNPLTGKMNNFAAYQNRISKTSTISQLYNNLDHKPGFKNLTRLVKLKLEPNTLGGILSTNPCGEIPLPGVFENPYDAVTKNYVDSLSSSINWSNLSEAEIKMIEAGFKIPVTCGPSETDVEMERRIDNDFKPIIRHKAEQNVGMKDEYLLIN